MAKSSLLKSHQFKHRNRACVETSPTFPFFAGAVGIGVGVFYRYLENFQFWDVDNIFLDPITAQIRLHRFWYFQNIRTTE